MAEKRRLGRGLDSLIPTLEPEPPVERTEPGQIPLRQIELNPDQPRARMDPEELQRLAESIRSSGLIQPVLVRPTAVGGYELVVGERRVRAARLAGLESVPAVVREVPDEKMLEIALVENIQRADLNPIEKAAAIRRMIADLELTQEDAGGRLGMDRSTVANLLRLLELSDELKDMVSRGTLSAGHARALLSVPHEGARARLARKIIALGLSVRAAERMAAAETSGGPRRIRPPSPNVVELEENLSKALGTRVEIKPGRKKGGKLTIRYASHEDFERIYEALTGHATTDEFGDRISA
jgi:ParB family chromosome partitioning protein